VSGVTLEVRAGQVLGVAGVAGNGQRELAECLAGLRPPLAGQVLLGGVDVTRASPLHRIRLGMGFVPEDRLGMGLASGLSLEDNLVLKSYRWPPHSRGPLLSYRAIHHRARELIERFDIRGVRPGLPVRLLSGGNLQRAILAREISQRPRVLVAASPTRGLDVGATEAIRRILLDQRAEGTGILLISEDLDEVRALSDRILVMYGGRVVGEVDPESFDLEEVGLLMAGHGTAAS
jgi:simple sugar transport system ATP-binding protein